MGLMTVEDAMKVAEKEHKKNKKKTVGLKSNKEIIPVWFNNNNEKVEVSEDEKKELESLLEKFR